MLLIFSTPFVYNTGRILSSVFMKEIKERNTMYREEHPKPQFERKNWLNLNGKWQFEIDNGNSGAARGY